MLRREERAKNSLEIRKTSKTPNPPKSVRINDNDKTHSKRSRTEKVDLDDKDMDTEDLNGPLTKYNKYFIRDPNWH